MIEHRLKATVIATPFWTMNSLPCCAVHGKLETVVLRLHGPSCIQFVAAHTTEEIMFPTRTSRAAGRLRRNGLGIPAHLLAEIAGLLSASSGLLLFCDALQVAFGLCDERAIHVSSPIAEQRACCQVLASRMASV